uniref:Fibronectin type-III domain-containing protein n=1 Tax=Globodera rostochiensis TaxID=31243 RepID=A0A914GWQ1_GLORO
MLTTSSSSTIPPPLPPSASSFSSTLPIGRRSPPSCTSSPEVVAVPVWQNDGMKQQQQQQSTTTMEPIPEDEEESVFSASTSFIGQPEASPTAHPSTSAQSPTSALPPCKDGQHRFSSPTFAGMDTEIVAKRITESKRRLRETYTTEEIDTLVSTLPKDSVPVEWEHFSTKEVVVDPKMAHTYVTELAGGIPSARGTKYSYTYESRVEEEGQNEMEETQSERRRRRRSSEEAAEEHPPVTQLRSEEEERELDREVRRGEDGTERHCTSTQKITRVTKITTTRQVKQIPVDPGDVYFDADGNPILNGFDAQNISAGSNPDEEEFSGGLDSSVGIDLSRTYISESEQYFSSPQTSSTTQQGSQSVSPPMAGDDRYFTATPGAPGLPEVTELTDSTISLAWLRPDFDGTAGPLIGYRVEFRRSDFDDWDPAHDDLLGETECKITNLDVDECYQFRVLGANIGGFGTPSAACAPIQLRKDAQEAEPPPPPGRPHVVELGSDRATIEWQPSVSAPNGDVFGEHHRRGEMNGGEGTGGTLVGYVVEYRAAAGTSEWTPANDRPISEHRFTVQNLRPNGEYEFRVLARDKLGRQSSSPSSGFVRIRPSVPFRQQSLRQQPPPPPGQPKLLESGPSWVHLCWEAPRPQPSHPIAYLVELRQLVEAARGGEWAPLGQQRVGEEGGEAKTLVTTSLGHFIVENLSPAESAVGYEFRVWTVSLVNGLCSAIPSPVSDPIRLNPGWPVPADQPHTVSNRRPPERPFAPEYLEYNGGTSLTLCWLPAKSALPVQGYEVEFRDIMQDATHWYRMTDQLVRACKTTVGYLLNGHQYQFRIIAKNSAGLSDPSDPSPLITIDSDGATERHIGVPLADEMVRESPPLPDRDDSPPPIYRQTESSLQWRDPTLKEVVDYLKSPDQTLVLDASGYLQHLTFNNDLIKEETRNYGGIECLVSLLRSPNHEILRNVCGCLKNLAFGRANDANKRLINSKGGVKALTQLLRHVNVPLTVQEEVTGALWNISSADELKESVLNQAAETVVSHVVLPSAAQLRQSQQQLQPPTIPQQTRAPSSALNARNSTLNVFRNGVGILRNISAVNDSARRFLRSAPGLVDVLLDFLEGSVQRVQLDNRTVENVICLLRNLSYRVQEVVDPKYDPNRPRYQMHGDSQLQQDGQLSFASARSERSRSAPAGSPKTPSGKKGRLFPKGKGKKGTETEFANSTIPLETGPHRLWHPNTVKLYLRVLQESADSEILEASTAAIQNLAGCPFDGSSLVRQTVRTEKGLPVLVELLRLREDRVVCAVCCALRNLALDQRNLELIGKYALAELLTKLPDRTGLEKVRSNPALPIASDATVGAVLGLLWEAVRHSAELARAVHETANGTERLRTVAKSYPTHGRRVCKYATQVLFMMWQNKELHELFRRDGLSEADFYSGTLHRGGKGGGGKEQQNYNSSSPSSVATTLARPFSSQGVERPAHLIGMGTPRTDDGGGGDTSQYGALTPSQSRKSETPVSGTLQKQTMISGSHLDRRQFDQNLPLQIPAADSHLYASVQKENGRPSLGSARRRSIDSWV